MRFAFLCAVAMAVSFSAGAHEIQHHAPSLNAAPATVLGADASGLTETIAQALAAELGLPRLQSFQVHWNSPNFQCLRVTHEMAEGLIGGVCLVGVSALQVMAITQIIVQDGALQVSILNAVIE